MIRLFLIIFLFYLTNTGFAQQLDSLILQNAAGNDSLRSYPGTTVISLPVNDTLKTVTATTTDSSNERRLKKRLFWRDSIPVPKRSVILSAIVPGAGQLYNGKNWYWKIPIIYGGLYAGYRYIDFNADKYYYYKDVYYCRVNDLGDKLNNPLVSDESVKRVRDAYYKEMQQAYVLTFFWYLLNVADAFVEAHLYSFDVSNDLSLHLDPKFQFVPERGTGVGLGLSMRF